MKNLPIIVGISLPVVMVLVIFLVVALPSRFINPQQEFVFSYSDENYNTAYQSEFEVVNGEIEKVEALLSERNKFNENVIVREIPDIYTYNFETGSIKKITFEEAQKLKLDRGPSNSEGYSIDFNYRGDRNIATEIFGNSSRNYNVYVIKGSKVKGIKIPSIGDGYYYNNNRKFIGWVIN